MISWNGRSLGGGDDSDGDDEDDRLALDAELRKSLSSVGIGS